MRWLVCVILSVAVFALWPQNSTASDGKDEGSERNPPMALTRLSLERTAGADIDGTSASFGFTEISAGLEWKFLLLDIDHREYEWEKSDSFDNNPGDDPWESLTRIAPGLQYYHEFSERWKIWPKIVAFAGFEDEASSESWTYNPQVVGVYVPAKRLAFYGGLGMLHHTVDQIVYPVFGVAWNLKSKVGFAGAVGFPETKVRYGFNERIALEADFQYDIRYYHLAEDSNLEQDGFIKTIDLIFGLKIEYELIKGLNLILGGRQYFGRELIVFDRKENELTTDNVGASLAYFLEVEYRF